MGFGLANELCLETTDVTFMLEHFIVVALAPLPCGILTGGVVQDVVAPIPWNLRTSKNRDPRPLSLWACSMSKQQTFIVLSH